jgi:esterase/lipase superfamily enzyme
MRRIYLACFVVLLAGLPACAPHLVAQRGIADPDGDLVRMHVAMQRPFDKTGPMFGQERQRHLNYFRVDISVPPTHQPGRIEWSQGDTDPARHFVVSETKVLPGGSDFLKAVRSTRNAKETSVFVHGYNNTLSDAMFRLAQMQVDFRIPDAPVLFSWPSAGDARGYIYDRDSVLFARDALEDLLGQLTARSDERVLLLAHSMGAHLVMEVMRQAALRGDRQLLNRISGVVLMSPDIDPDLFRQQAQVIGTLPQPFLIFVSQQDRALGLAAFITGRKPRLGVIDGPAAVAGLPVKVIDFSRLSDGEAFGHTVPATSPSAIRILRGMMEQVGQGIQAFTDYMVLTATP